MAITNHERVGRALTALHKGLYPFFKQEMQAVHGDNWTSAVSGALPEHYMRKRKKVENILHEDLSSVLIAMWTKWNDVFKRTLGQAERTLVSELRNTRNDWAHTKTWSGDDTYRALDSAARLLSAIASPEATTVEKQKQELLRLRYEEQTRRETRKRALAPTEGEPDPTLKPWREVVTPHRDVASGIYQKAEFAADLWQVYLDDECSSEYRDPTEFFKRTYLTEGLKQLLINALKRLSGKGGDPVIELQTNFGGGKTHAMLALYHLCFGLSAKDLPGLDEVFKVAGVRTPPQNVNTVVLVGNKIAPGQPDRKVDGVIVRTLWGEIAWQLGFSAGGLEEAVDAYEMIREADETSTNPGDTLKDLFNRYSPCLILIDEWVAYARQLHDHGENALPGGSFDTQFTFAQTLSESAKNAQDTLLVASIPASEIEQGGDRGHEATERLKNAIGRVESPWRPASADESFEIVRRRLFEPITDTKLFVARDTTIKAFAEMYRTQSAEFPSECKETDYERRMHNAYPIHLELFERLYSDWSSLEKFQRTRGVLRLMAQVIHSLWDGEDRSLLILPAHVPVDDPRVQPELTQHLEANWVPIIEKDVDGPNSLSLAIDRNIPNLGRYSACRRVSRTIFLGSAPTLGAANRGIDDNRIRLGCAQPGEPVGVFGDALRRLTDKATYIYLDSNRYWLSTQPNVTRTAQDRAAQLLASSRYKVREEIVCRLKNEKQRGEFCAVHIAPESTMDIPDDVSQGVRLIVLGPQHSHIKRSDNSPARQWIDDITFQKGTGPRYYKNTLVFLAPDTSKLENLEQTTAQYLAWESIMRDDKAQTLNLDNFQRSQATTKRDRSKQDVKNILWSTYHWLLVPTQPDPQDSITWEDIRLQGQGSSVVLASRKLVHEEHLITTYAASLLSSHVLDAYLWKDSTHINLKQLWEYMAQYLYLPRLKNSSVLLAAIRDGVAATTGTDRFGYAESWNENKEQYSGLKVGEIVTPVLSSQSLLVKLDVAQKQLAEERAAISTDKAKVSTITIPTEDGTTSSVKDGSGGYALGGTPSIPISKPVVFKRFHGSVDLDALRINRDASAIADEIIQHLTSLKGATVDITLEIQADIPEGATDEVVRTVTENCSTLKFTTYEFEQE